MAANKTQLNNASVSGFLISVENEQKRKDKSHIINMMEKATGEKPEMWGTSIIGFGTYHYK